MTFYWWSHWFWITAFTNIFQLLTLSSNVHTYPSLELTSSQQLSQYVSATQKPVTKLYQQINTTQSWETTTTGANVFREELSTGQSITKLQSITDQTPILLNRKEYGSSNEDKNVNNKASKLLENFDEEYENEEEFISPMDIKRAAEGEKQNMSLSANQSNNQANIRNLDKHNFTNFSNAETTTMDSRNLSSIENINSTTTTTTTKTYNEGLTNTTELGLDSSSELATPLPSASENAKWDNLNGEADDSTGSANSISLAIQKVPFTLENANKLEELRLAENEHRARKSKVLSADYQHASRILNYPLDSKNLLTRSAAIAANELDGARRKLGDEGNISTEALAIKRTYYLDAGTISAACLTIFGICCTIGTAGIVLYRRRSLNKPHTLSEPDSSVYIDDSTMRISDNSDEMYSLDNDSFLNSLEAMTIQNYWTDTVKHTKL